jgi:hypothetical protein
LNSDGFCERPIKGSSDGCDAIHAPSATWDLPDKVFADASLPQKRALRFSKLGHASANAIEKRFFRPFRSHPHKNYALESFPVSVNSSA